MEKVCVIGLGYIGLPTAAIIADKGIEVIGVDINEELLESIRNGEINEEEPGLKSIVNEVISNGTLKITTQIQKADIFIIAVPTPLKYLNSGDPIPNMDIVYDVAKQLANYIEKGKYHIQ